MRRPVGVKWIGLLFHWTRFFSCRVATVATLPSRLFVKRFLFARCKLGVLVFSRCCHLIFDLGSISGMETGPGHRRSPRNSALGFAFPSLEYFDFMLPPAFLPNEGCAAVRTLLHSPTSDAARRLTSVPWQSRLAFFRSSRHTRPASTPNVADRCPLQTVPECGALPAPAAF
jgi:hypothetical protein